MSVQENKDLVRRYFDTIWNKGQLEREPEFVALDIVVRAPHSRHTGWHRRTVDHCGYVPRRHA